MPSPARTWPRRTRASLFKNDPLPEPDSVNINYYNYTLIHSTPLLAAVYSPGDEQYALVRVKEVDATIGEVRVETWFQPVKQLRLIGHDIDRAGF